MPTARQSQENQFSGRKILGGPQSETIETEDRAEVLPGTLLAEPASLTGEMQFRAMTPLTLPAERRAYARAKLGLPVRIMRIAGRRVVEPDTFFTMNMSSSGTLVRCPFALDSETPVDMEIELIRHAPKYGRVLMLTVAHLVRREENAPDGWHGLAFDFDDITFERSEPAPPDFAA
jgi:hypothetical protein